MSDVISVKAKDFLISIGLKPRYINKNGFRCLSIMSDEAPLYMAQKVLNDLTNTENVSLDLFRAFLYFKYEGFGLESTIYWPNIPFEAGNE